MRNTVEDAVVLATGSSISPDHLPARLMESSYPQGTEEAGGSRRSEEQREPESEREQLIRILRQTGGNQSKAAGLLGVSRVTVWKRIKKHGIDLAAEL